MDWRPLRGSRLIHRVRQEDKPQPMKQDYRSFDSLKIKYMNFDNVQSVMFTKLESSISQRRVCIIYTIHF